MDCPRCHGRLSGRDRFCPHCGLLVEELVANLAVEEDSVSPSEEDQADAQGSPEVESSAPSLSMQASSTEDDEVPVGNTSKEQGVSFADNGPQDDSQFPGASDAEPGDDGLDDKEDVEPAFDQDLKQELESDFDPELEPSSGLSYDADFDSDFGEEFEVASESASEEPDDLRPESEYGSNPESNKDFEPERTSEPKAHEKASDLDDTLSHKALVVANPPVATTIETDTPLPEPEFEDWEDQPRAKREFVGLNDEDDRRPLLSSTAHRVVAIISLVVVVALVISSCVAWSMERGKVEAEQEAQAEAERVLHTAVPTPVSLTLPGFDAAQVSPVALRVVGASETGESINELRLVTPDDAVVTLLPGTYTISLGGAPASKQGLLYEGSVDSFDVVVRSANEQGEETVPQETPTFVFEQLEPIDVKDEQIDAARAWMAEANLQDANSYVDAVVARRKKELDERVSQQEAKEREEQAANEQAARTIEEQLKASKQTSNNYYSFVLPSSWQGKVQVTTTNDSSGAPITTVHLPGNPSAELARISYLEGTSASSTGGVDQHVVVTRMASDAKHHVEVRTTNWPHIVSQGNEVAFANVGADDAELLVSLSTGGELTYEDVFSGYNDELVLDAEREFNESAFASLVAY